LAEKRLGANIHDDGFVMTNISDVNVMDVRGKIEHRETKYCVCIYAGDDKDRYFLINTNSPEIESHKIYDDFLIKESENSFLKCDRYVNCSYVQELERERIIEKAGNLNYEDMRKILDKIKSSKRITAADKDIIIPALEKWLNSDDYAKNKLSAVFKYR
jgi:hypothetical protein